VRNYFDVSFLVPSHHITLLTNINLFITIHQGLSANNQFTHNNKPIHTTTKNVLTASNHSYHVTASTKTKTYPYAYEPSS
jgi:hypothetical protein